MFHWSQVEVLVEREGCNGQRSGLGTAPRSGVPWWLKKFQFFVVVLGKNKGIHVTPSLKKAWSVEDKRSRWRNKGVRREIFT